MPVVMNVEIRGGATLLGTVQTPGFKDWISIARLTMRISRTGDEDQAEEAHAQAAEESARRAETLQSVIAALSPSAAAVGGTGPQVQLAAIEQLRKAGTSNWRQASVKRGSSVHSRGLLGGRTLRNVASLDEFRITKALDRSSPGLFRWATRDASPIETVQRAECDVTVCVLKAASGNAPADWAVRYTFSDCIPEFYDVVYSDGSEPATEILDMRAAKVKIEYREFAADGTLLKGRDAMAEYAVDAGDS